MKCESPNICVVHVKLERTIRLIGIDASKNKAWGWDILSDYITDYRSLFGDFNMDLDCKTDEKAAKNLLNWFDAWSLAPVLPRTATSVRSNRVIDENDA